MTNGGTSERYFPDVPSQPFILLKVRPAGGDFGIAGIGGVLFISGSPAFFCLDRACGVVFGGGYFDITSAWMKHQVDLAQRALQTSAPKTP
jgi:hypothetical protein